MRRLPPLLLFFALLTTHTAVFGQTYQLAAWVIGSGAMNGSSTNFKAMGTLGQPVTGHGSSTNFEGSWGFWHTLSGVNGVVVLADLTVLLEGAYAGSGTMNAALGDSIPEAQPFGGAPWSYGGTESVAPGFFTSNPDVVDWVFVQVRDTTPAPTSPPMSVLAERAGFVLTDGSIVDTDGVSPLSFPSLTPGTYYVVVDHRNHARAMTASGVGVVAGNLNYDFTDALAKAYTAGPDPMKSLSGGYFGLFAGDANADGQIIASDFNSWLTQTKAVSVGYLSGDFNLDTQVIANDFNLWLVNTKAVYSSQVPNP